MMTERLAMGFVIAERLQIHSLKALARFERLNFENLNYFTRLILA